MADAVRAMRWTPPPAPPPRDPAVIHLVEAALDGRPPDPGVLARYLAPGAVAEREARAAQAAVGDWPDLARYRHLNSDVHAPELVMIGDSITEIWSLADPDLFGPDVVSRGISGQTSPQILLRFMADVVALRPRAVHILCGTNDVAGNTGPTTPDDYQRNVRAMIDLAGAHGIAVLLGSVTPARAISWRPDAEPLVYVPILNAWLRDEARSRGLTYLDYWTALADADGGLAERFSADGVHLTRAAYAVMRDLLLNNLPSAVERRRR